VFVLDASIALAWCFRDEATDAADRVLDRLAGDAAVVPSIWPLEVANGLRTAERRGRLDPADTHRLREVLLSLPIAVEPSPLGDALGEVIDLARLLDLTAYDAAYIALAARRGIPLATADERLRRATAQAGVELLER
jgi:predicted nucleic acid-binding protein